MGHEPLLNSAYDLLAEMIRSQTQCPVTTTLQIIGGKWKVLILWHLRSGTKRFSELHRTVTGISQKILTQELRDLEATGLLSRHVFPVVPPRVEYSLTELGHSLEPVLKAMCSWGQTLQTSPALEESDAFSGTTQNPKSLNSQVSRTVSKPRPAWVPQPILD